MVSTNPRAILYSRVSSTTQAEKGYSIPEQLEACRAKAAEYGAIVSAEYSDPGFSGATLERPGLRLLRECVRLGLCDMVIARSIDRVSRKLVGYLLLCDEFARAGVRLVFVDGDRNPSPDGRLIERFREVYAEYERRKLHQRSMAGARKKAETGRIPYWFRLYGYRYKDGKLIPDPFESEVVERIFQLSIDGYGREAIASHLNAAGIPAPRGGSWSERKVFQMLRQTAYRGELPYFTKDPSGPPIRIAVPPIVADHTFYEARLAAKNRDGHGGPITCSISFGRIRCGVCGDYMHRWTKRKRTYYRCGSQWSVARAHTPGAPSIPCSNGRHAATAVESAVWQALVNLIGNEDAFLDWLSRAKGRHERTQAELEVLHKQRGAILSLQSKGLATVQEVQRVLRDTDLRMAWLTSVTSADSLVDAVRNAGSVGLDGLQKICEKPASLALRRRVVTRLIETIHLGPGTTISLEPRSVLSKPSIDARLSATR